jgi:HEPN domain-containing protein
VLPGAAASEKAIKALLLHRRVHSPYIHDLSDLVNLLKKSGETIPSFLDEVVTLTDFAVQARYPGPAEEVTREEYEETVDLADQVVRWVAEKIGYTPSQT